MIKLRDHQQKAVELARRLPHLALFFDAGTGKTGAMIRILAEHFNKRKGICKTLIFAPISVCQQWQNEAPRFSGIPGETFHIMTGPGKVRVSRMEQILLDKPNAIVVTNYEAVQIKGFYELLLKWSPEVVVLDESHRIKDSQSKRAKAIYPLCHAASRRFLLTGTPIVNSLLDIFGQYKALDPSIFGGGFWSFKNKFFYDKNAGKQFAYPDWAPHPWAAEQIGKALAASSLQAKREDCLDLPPLTAIPVPVELSSQQKKAYDEMRKDFMTEVKGLVTSSEFEMVKTLRMQQMLAGFSQPDEREDPIWFDDVPRLDALLDTIDSLGKEKAIIWTVFRPTYARLAKELEKRSYKFAMLTGEQSYKEKMEAKEAFVNGDAQFLIANPAAAGEGIDGLQIAKYALYYMRGYSLLHYMQSLARNYRSGSEKHDKVVHYHYFAKGTLDEVIAYALHNKQDVAATVLKWAQGSNFSLDLAKSQE